MGNAGIDYGRCVTNIDLETGIRFGVIALHSVSGDALNDLEPDYGEPACPQCCNKVVELTMESDSDEDYPQYTKHGCADYICHTCKHTLDSSDVFGAEPKGFTYDSDGYKLTQCLDSDIFVLKSNYYTFAQFCSPCVPGAGNLDNPMADGAKCYALGHDWFEGEIAPYPVWRVSDNAMVCADRVDVKCGCYSGKDIAGNTCWRCNGKGFAEDVQITVYAVAQAREILNHAIEHMHDHPMYLPAVEVLSAAYNEVGE